MIVHQGLQIAVPGWHSGIMLASQDTDPGSMPVQGTRHSSEDCCTLWAKRTQGTMNLP